MDLPELEPFPDLAALNDEGLKELIEKLQEEERVVSYRRRVLHGRIDMLRAELQNRLKAEGGPSILEHIDIAKLTDILAEKAAPPLKE
ncbi:MAG: hypothetical protein M3R70_06825 [Actinomycetota bacterium]|nr:hypothetical protein [Actinomycetota bacterium]